MLVPDSLSHCLVRREPAWPETDAGGGGGARRLVTLW